MLIVSKSGHEGYKGLLCYILTKWLTDMIKCRDAIASKKIFTYINSISGCHHKCAVPSGTVSLETLLTISSQPWIGVNRFIGELRQKLNVNYYISGDPYIILYFACLSIMEYWIDYVGWEDVGILRKVFKKKQKKCEKFKKFKIRSFSHTKKKKVPKCVLG